MRTAEPDLPSGTARTSLPNCPSCGGQLQIAQTGEHFCPECRPASVQPAQPRRPSASNYVRRFPATTVLIAINTVVFLAMVLNHVSVSGPTVEQLIRWGGDSGDRVLLQNQWWR